MIKVFLFGKMIVILNNNIASILKFQNNLQLNKRTNLFELIILIIKKKYKQKK